MLKQKEYNFADSNIANLGSDLEKKVKLAAAQGEKAFAGVGKVPGLVGFRVEKFTVRKLDQKEIGCFYDGDSYIILHTYKKGDALKWDVHFWLGKYTTQDEAGTAAYKTVELDDVLGGAPVQYRECQGYESKRFLDYFKAIRIMKGGIDSGFTHVTAKEYKPRLLWFNGKINRVIVRQVALEAKAMNKHDVFILDLGLTLYQWNGSKASAGEKNKAAIITRAIDDERGSKVKITVLEEGDQDTAEFFGYLAGEAGDVSADAVDAATHPELQAPKKLMKLSDASGSMKFEEVASGQVKRSQLNTMDVFVFDAGAEVFVWIGKGANSAERAGGLQYAQQYIANSGRPAWLPICRVLEGGENETFEGMFD